MLFLEYFHFLKSSEYDLGFVRLHSFMLLRKLHKSIVNILFYKIVISHIVILYVLVCERFYRIYGYNPLYEYFQIIIYIICVFYEKKNNNNFVL